MRNIHRRTGNMVRKTDKVLNEIYEGTKEILNDDKFPFMIGGEHLVTLPVFKAISEKYGDVYVLHFDAHTDLREEYNNDKNSHATVIKSRKRAFQIQRE